MPRWNRLIPTALSGDLCPRSCGDGGYPFGIVDEGVPGCTAGLDDRLNVAEIVATQVFPDILDRVQLRGIGWQTEQGDMD